MPISKYFGGHGEEVAANMQRQYGSDWKRVFYATANKRGQAPKRKRRRHSLVAENLVRR
jgi:hypothetical protein